MWSSECLLLGAPTSRPVPIYTRTLGQTVHLPLSPAQRKHAALEQPSRTLMPPLTTSHTHLGQEQMRKRNTCVLLSGDPGRPFLSPPWAASKGTETCIQGGAGATVCDSLFAALSKRPPKCRHRKRKAGGPRAEAQHLRPEREAGLRRKSTTPLAAVSPSESAPLLPSTAATALSLEGAYLGAICNGQTHGLPRRPAAALPAHSETTPNRCRQVSDCPSNVHAPTCPCAPPRVPARPAGSTWPCRRRAGRG